MVDGMGTGFLVAGWVYGWMCVSDCLFIFFLLFGGMGGFHDGWMGLLVLFFLVLAEWGWVVGWVRGLCGGWVIFFYL